MATKCNEAVEFSDDWKGETKQDNVWIYTVSEYTNRRGILANNVFKGVFMWNNLLFAQNLANIEWRINEKLK